MAKMLKAGAVKVDFVAGSAQFVKESKRTMSRIDRFKNHASRAAKVIKQNWKAIAGSVAAVSAAYVYASKQLSDYSSALVENSKSTGLAVKELEALRLLFKGDGLEVKKTDKAFQAFNNRIGQAILGYGSAKRALESLGVEVKDSAGKARSTAEIFYDVASKVKNLGSESAATAALFDMMGNDAKLLAPIILRHGENLRDAARHANRFNTISEDTHELAKELGQSFSDLGDATKNLAFESVAPAVEELTELNRVLTELAQQSVDPANWFGDFASQGIDKFTDILKLMGESVGFDLYNPRELLGKRVGLEKDIFALEKKLAAGDFGGIFGEKLGRSLIEDAIKDLQDEMSELDKRIMAAVPKSSPVSEPATLTGEDSEDSKPKKPAKKVETAVEKMIRESRKYLAPMPDISWELMKPLTEMWLQEFYRGLLEAKTAKLNRTRIGAADVRSMQSLDLMRIEQLQGGMTERTVYPSPVMSANERERIERNAARRQATQRRRFDLADAASFGSLNAVRGWQPKDDGFEARLAGSKAWWDTAEIDRIKEGLEELSPIAKRLQQGFESFTDSLIDGFDNAGDAVKSLAKDLLKMAWRQTVTEPLSQALFGAGGFVAGLGIPGFAEGGRAHGLALVGERGPELVDFSRPGMVYSNDKLRSAMSGGGGAPVFNIVVNSTDGPGVRAAIAEARPALVQSAMSATAEAATRRGNFRSAIRGRR